MEQLTFKDLVNLFEQLKEKYSIEEILEMPVYIGDDDELNGIHCAWHCEEVNEEQNNSEEDYVIEMINNTAGNIKFKDKAILIS